MAERIPFEQLENSDFVVNAIYEGGTKGNASDDALAKLLKAGNQGGSGFTASGKRTCSAMRSSTRREQRLTGPIAST
jgi:hypothetical protein